MLALNILSFAAHHLMTLGPSSSPGVLLYACLFGPVVDYLVFERVHLYTYDIFAERVGFKLGWGCLTFYPYFYAVGSGPPPVCPTPTPRPGSSSCTPASFSRVGRFRAAPTCRNSSSRRSPNAPSSAS